MFSRPRVIGYQIASVHPPLQGEGRPPQRSEGGRGGVSNRHRVCFTAVTPTRLRCRAVDLPPAGGGEALHACRPSLSATVQVRQWSCGIAMWVEPKNLKASFIALAKHGTPPTFGLSPTPLAPIGRWGEGVVVQSVSQTGVSTAVGRK